MKAITVNYTSGARAFAQRLFGRRPTNEELARLAGALEGATVEVSVRRQKGWLYLTIDDPAQFEIYETSVRRDAQGELYAYIHEVRVSFGQGGQGLGLRAFLRQVAGAKALSVRRFELWAARNVRDTSHNGYYTWARFGFDAPLGKERVFLPARLSTAQTVNDLILKGEHEWWKQHGTDRTMIFDLSDGSSMMRVFRAYLKEKGLTEE